MCTLLRVHCLTRDTDSRLSSISSSKVMFTAVLSTLSPIDIGRVTFSMAVSGPAESQLWWLRRTFKKVRCRLIRNPEQSQRKMAPKPHMSRQSLQRIIETKLGQRALKWQKCQVLTKANKRKRFDRCKVLLPRFGFGCHPEVVFYDEMFFPLQMPYCAQNDRVYGRSVKELHPKFRLAPRMKKVEMVAVGIAVS